MRKSIVAAVVGLLVVTGCTDSKLHKAMEDNNSMVFMYRSINTQLQQWPKGNTVKEKTEAIEKLLKEVKDKRAKLKDLKVVKELRPVKEELDRYFATVEEGYTKILASYRNNKESEVAAQLKELNAKLKAIAQNLIALQQKAAKELGVKINRQMVKKAAPKKDGAADKKDSKADGK